VPCFIPHTALQLTATDHKQQWSNILIFCFLWNISYISHGFYYFLHSIAIKLSNTVWQRMLEPWARLHYESHAILLGRPDCFTALMFFSLFNLAVQFPRQSNNKSGKLYFTSAILMSIMWGKKVVFSWTYSARAASVLWSGYDGFSRWQ
jgi:hypothetical protein